MGDKTFSQTGNTELIPLLVQIAHLYYEEELSQQEIANRLNVSRSLIALYLKKAREIGIVHIEIVNPQNTRVDLSARLAERFHLHYAHIVSSVSSSQLLTRRALGSAMQAYLDQILKEDDVLGLGWGRTINEMVNVLSPSRPRRIDVVPLLGESGYTGSYTQLNQMVLQTARCFNGTPYFLLAPVLVETPELRERLVQDAAVRQVAERWKHLTVACVGIGSTPASEGQVVYLGENIIPDLIARGAVGDICGRYYDLHGTFIDHPTNHCMIAVSLEELRSTGKVIAVAGGVEKAAATAGALRTGLISALIVDESLARTLLQSPAD
jgi:deoxyribonucleoside regulator